MNSVFQLPWYHSERPARPVLLFFLLCWLDVCYYTGCWYLYFAWVLGCFRPVTKWQVLYYRRKLKPVKIIMYNTHKVRGNWPVNLKCWPVLCGERLDRQHKVSSCCEHWCSVVEEAATTINDRPTSVWTQKSFWQWLYSQRRLSTQKESFSTPTVIWPNFIQKNTLEIC